MNLPSSSQTPKLQVDAVLCISLKERRDRRRMVADEFKKSGLQIEFVLVDKDVEDSQRGCFMSHQQCARLIIERGYRNALILEDDATLLTWKASRIQRLNRFLQTVEPELLHLGVILGKMWLTWHPGIARCRAAGAHAYIISRAASEKLLNYRFNGLGIDTLYRREFKQYCAFPMLSQQQPHHIAGSDIEATRRRVVLAEKGQHRLDVDLTWNLNRRKQYRQILINAWKTAFRG